MRWFQIDKDYGIFNLANITHFKVQETDNKFEIFAYFNFSTREGLSQSISQYREKIGFSGNEEACKQTIKDIIEGKYDVSLSQA